MRATNIGFIFQSFMLLDALTVLENVALVLRFSGMTRKEIHEHAQNILETLQIGHLWARYPSVLSQGEKQRVAVACAITNNGRILLADEPTASVELVQGI